MSLVLKALLPARTAGRHPHSPRVMHPRNRYLKNPADFGELAEYRPSLKPYLIEKHKQRRHQVLPPASAPTSTDSEGTHSKGTEGFAYTLDFSNSAALKELTCAVLEKDFDLKLEIPVDRLIPTVPQKLNYIHWLEDLLSNDGGVALQKEGVVCEGAIPKGRNIIGIDIGMSTAWPQVSGLMTFSPSFSIGTGNSCIYPLLGSRLNGWCFIATDIAMDTVQCATNNVSRNNLEDHIQGKNSFTYVMTTILQRLQDCSLGVGAPHIP